MAFLPNYVQSSFRIRNDDGSETGASWRQSENVNDTLAVDTNYRIRFAIANTGIGIYSSVTFSLFYSLNGNPFVPVAAGQAVKLSESSHFSQGDDTTRQLTPVGAFIADNNGMCESAGATNSGGGSSSFEVEYCFQIDGAYVANGDTINLRVHRTGPSTMNSYIYTPLITVSAVGGGASAVPVIVHSYRRRTM